MIDLKELMENRSAHQPAASHLRLSQVQRKITARHRRRVTTGAVGVVALMVVLLFGVYQVKPALDNEPPPNPAATASPTIQQIEGFPEYAFGYRVVAATEMPVAGAGASLVWTPTGGEFQIVVECRQLPPTVTLAGEVLLNGTLLTTFTGCLQVHGDKSTLDRAGAQIGMPTTVRITSLRAMSGGVEVALPKTGTLGLAVKLPVAFTEFPLPARPAQLTPIGQLRMCEEKSDAVIDTPNYLRSDPNDPLKARTTTITWRDNLFVYAVTQTPGTLHITFNGIEVSTSNFWDYRRLGSARKIDTSKPLAGLSPKHGDQVVVTVRPEHVTGEWQVRVFQSDHATQCVIDPQGNGVSFG